MERRGNLQPRADRHPRRPDLELAGHCRRQTPPGSHWKNIGDAIAEAGAIVGRVDQLEMDVTDVDGKVAAQGQKVDGLFAQLDVRASGDGNWGAGDDSVFAGSTSLQTVIAEGDLALAKRVDTVEASIEGVPGKIEGVSAAVQQVSQAVVNLDGKVSATYTVKAQITSAGQIYMAGMGLGVEQKPDGSYQSQILMQADRFALINTNSGQVSAPFVVQRTDLHQPGIDRQWLDPERHDRRRDPVQRGRSRWATAMEARQERHVDDERPENGGRLTINDSVIHVYDNNGRVRVRMGIW